MQEWGRGAAKLEILRSFCLLKWNGPLLSPCRVLWNWDFGPSRRAKKFDVSFYPRDAMLARYLLSSRVCPSVRPPVTSRYCIRMAKRRISKTTPHGTLVLRCKRSLRNSDGITPNWSAPYVASGVVKNCVFDRSKSLQLRKLTDENLCPSATVVRIHDGALLSTVTVQLTSTRLVVRKSIDDTRGIACWLCDSCAYCNAASTKLCR